MTIGATRSKTCRASISALQRSRTASFLATESDLIKGAGNRSSVGTLVERTTGFVVLAKMDNATTKAVVDSFSAVLNRNLRPRARNARPQNPHQAHRRPDLFADPHSPWQRGSNENTNGLLHQYMPKGSDLSIYSQGELDAIALSLNTKPRARLDYESPLVVYIQYSHCYNIRSILLINPVLRLVLETAPGEPC